MTDPHKPSTTHRAFVFLARWAIRVPLFLISLWCFLALGFDLPYAGWPLALGLSFLLGYQLRAAKRERVRLAWLAGGCLAVIGWWMLLPPSNARDWNQTCKVLCVPEFAGSKVTLRKLRDFKHTSPTTFEAGYSDLTVSLDDLESVDVLFDDFLGPGPVSHTMLGFGFKGGKYVCLTIEPRRAEGNPYSIPRACFKGFEIIYHIGDERDIVYQCTNVLDQDVYLYRLKLTPEQRRRLCESVFLKAASLAERPEWYNFLTNNCTNNLLWHAGATRIDWREREVFLNGTGDRLLYERGLIATHLPHDELRRRSRINELAKAAGDAPDFSTRIRANLVDPGHAE